MARCLHLVKHFDFLNVKSEFCQVHSFALSLALHVIMISNAVENLYNTVNY